MGSGEEGEKGDREFSEKTEKRSQLFNKVIRIARVTLGILEAGTMLTYYMIARPIYIMCCYLWAFKVSSY